MFYLPDALNKHFALRNSNHGYSLFGVCYCPEKIYCHIFLGTTERSSITKCRQLEQSIKLALSMSF